MLFGKRSKPPVNLALQGGGTHGAFTWGVLDALLRDGRLHFDAVSGTSAGAMNAVVLAHGLLDGGREGAIFALRRFWESVARSSPFELAAPGPDGDLTTLSPATRMMLQWARHFSPQQLNPFDINPLRDILDDHVDFERLRAESPVKLFIAATHVNTGKLRIFQTHELTAEALLASACLPAISRAVEIDGEPYWDGAYSANPAVFPLFYDSPAADIILVLLSPLLHGTTPQDATAIRDRVMDLGFNATFLREMRMYAHASEFAARSHFPHGRLERRLLGTHFHMIEAEELMSQLAAETKLAISLPFIEMLSDQGRARAQAWLDAHYDSVGKTSSIDIRALFY
ncbi:MAG: patatin-like phospholipase family protein [Rhodocyclaceae bacterium]